MVRDRLQGKFEVKTTIPGSSVKKPNATGKRWLAWDASTRSAFAQPGGVGLKVLQAGDGPVHRLGCRACS